MPLPAQMAPWERQRGETSKAYEAFCVYRDLPLSKRTIAEAAEKLGKHRTGLEHWAQRYNWKERVLAYDAYMAGLTLIDRKKELDEANKRHVQEARAIQYKAMEALQAMRPEDLKPAEILAFTEKAIDIERRALNVPNPAVQQEVYHHHTVEPPKRSEEEERDHMIAVVVELQKLGVLKVDGQLATQFANAVDLPIRDAGKAAETEVDEVHTDNPDA